MSTTKLKAEQLSDEVLTSNRVKTINNQSIVGTGNIDVGGSGSKAYLSLNKVKDYLYQTIYTDLDYTFAKDYFENKKPIVNLGACSTVRNGNFVGRNYDWNYTDSVGFVVSTPRTNDHFASISVASSIPGLTEEFMSSGSYDAEKFKIIPFFSTDGINEYGLTASNLVVPMQYGTTTGTTPTQEQKEEICNLMLVRYILDHFKTAAEAVVYLKKYVSIYTLESLKDMNYELHFMISDETETRVIEIINNTIVDIDITSIPYITNFFLYGATSSEITIGDDVPVGGVYTPATVSQGYKPSDLGITSLGSGLERYNFIVKNYAMAYDKEGMQKLLFNSNQAIASLRYTRSYLVGTDPQWNTEFVGEWLWEDEGGRHHVTLTNDNPAEDFTLVKNHVRPFYEAHVRDGKTWQTEHSSVYDLKNRKLYLIVQEDGEELEFGLNYCTRQEVDNKLVWERGQGENSIQTKGTYCIAKGQYSVAEGYDSRTIVNSTTGLGGEYAHAEGFKTTALGEASHTEGIETSANNLGEHAEGKCNLSNKASDTWGNAGNTLHSIGIGVEGDVRQAKNAFEVMQNGDAYMLGVGNYDGTNYSAAKTIQDVIDNKQDKYVIKEIDLSEATETATIDLDTYTTYTVTNLGTFGCNFIVSQPKSTVYFKTGDTLPTTLGIGFPFTFDSLELYLNDRKVDNITYEINTAYKILADVKKDEYGEMIALAYVYDGKGGSSHASRVYDLSTSSEVSSIEPETFSTNSIINLGTYGCHIIVSQPKASVFFTTGNTLPQTLDIGFPASFGGLDLYLNNVKVNSITFETDTTYYINTEVRVDASGDNIAVAFVCDGKGN